MLGIIPFSYHPSLFAFIFMVNPYEARFFIVAEPKLHAPITFPLYLTAYPPFEVSKTDPVSVLVSFILLGSTTSVKASPSLIFARGLG